LHKIKINKKIEKLNANPVNEALIITKTNNQIKKEKSY
jgi:hypothetical protein